jgi:small GTP-binding protein
MNDQNSCKDEFKEKKFKIVILGLGQVGKTATLYWLKLEDKVTTIPTIGFNCESIQHKGVSFVLYDVGGHERIRPLWKHYYEDTSGIIFVVDSTNEQTLEEAGSVFRKLAFEEKLEKLPILILANKQDVPGALPPKRLAEIMEINQIDNHKIKIIKTSATQGKGMNKVLDWFVERIQNKEEEMKIEECPMEYDSSEE